MSSVMTPPQAVLLTLGLKFDLNVYLHVFELKDNITLLLPMPYGPTVY